MIATGVILLFLVCQVWPAARPYIAMGAGFAAMGRGAVAAEALWLWGGVLLVASATAELLDL